MVSEELGLRLARRIGAWPRTKLYNQRHSTGSVAERLNAPVLKTGEG